MPVVNEQSPSFRRVLRRWWRASAILRSLAPALGLIAVLFGTSVVYGLAQSFGYLSFLGQRTITLAAYRNILTGGDYATEFWSGLLFSLWISGTATLLSAALALLLLLIGGNVVRRSSATTLVLNVHVAFPHLVWAIGIVLLLGQSGFLARVATATGLIGVPSDFPVLVRDSWGIGIILSYVSKEVPFLLLTMLAVLLAQPDAYDLVAENLGASRWQRLRYITLPLVLPVLSAASLLVFAFVFSAYEVPAVLGVRFPQMLSVLALELFLNPDLRSRSEGMALSVIMAAIVLVVAGAARLQSNRRAT